MRDKDGIPITGPDVTTDYPETLTGQEIGILLVHGSQVLERMVTVDGFCVDVYHVTVRGFSAVSESLVDATSKAIQRGMS